MLSVFEQKVIISLADEKLVALPTLDNSPPSVYIGPSLSTATLQALVKQGMKSIINLQAPTEATFNAADEKLMTDSGVTYFNIPVVPTAMTEDTIDSILAKIDTVPKPCVLMCASGKRAMAVAVMHESTRKREDTVARLPPPMATQFSSAATLYQFAMSYVSKKMTAAASLPTIDKLSDEFYVGPQPDEKQLQELAKQGVKSVLNLRAPSEAGNLGMGILPREKEIVEKLGLVYKNIPTKMGAPLSDQQASEILQAIETMPKPLFLHCRTKKRSLDVESRLWITGKINPQSEQKEAKVIDPVVKCLPHLPTATCTFIVHCPNTKQAAIIDSVMDFKANSGKCEFNHALSVLKYVQDTKLNVQYIIETHAHADHLTGAQWLKNKLAQTQAVAPKIAIGVNIKAVQKTFVGLLNLDANEVKSDGSQFDVLFADGQTFKIGDVDCKVMYTPGHTPACSCYLMGNSLFAGDTIFMPDVGTARCDFPGGSAHDLWNSIQKIFSLPDSTKIFVGHDYPPATRVFRWQTTVAEQKRFNKMVKVGTKMEEFVAARKTRDATLDVPNLLYPSLQVNIRAGNLPADEENKKKFIKIPLVAIEPVAPASK